MMYRKFNIVLCATFAFIQWTTFCSEQKNQIQKFYLVFSEKKNGNFSDQVNVTTINDTTVTTINGDMFFHGKDDNEKNKKIKFNRNTKVAVKDMQNSKALNKEAENHFFAQNLDNENDLIYLGSSKEETVNEIIKFYNDNIKKFNNSSSSNGSRSSGSSSNSSEEQHNNNAEEEEIDLAAKWVLESVESLIGSSEKTNQQLTTFQKKVNELEEQKKSNILSDSETKELTLQIQQLKEEQKKLKALISDLNNSL